jgi:predicted DNA-binding transcriptional regulator AlpA
MPPKAAKKIRKSIALPEDDDALVREELVLAVYPVGSTTLWSQIKAGTFPKPVKIAKRVNAWTVGSIRARLASVSEGSKSV